MVDISRTLPVPPTAVLNPDGSLSTDWYDFFITLWTRTGDAQGVDATEVLAIAAAAAADAVAAVITANAALAAAALKLAILQNLADLNNVVTARNNLGLTALATANPVIGWADPTGAGSRATFDMNFTTTVSNPPTQAQVTAIRDQLIVVQKRLGQSILDDKTVGVKAT